MSEGKKEILLGDCLELMKGLPENSVDAIVTDPPYGLTNPKKQKALRDLKIEMKKYEIEEPLEISDIMYRDMIYSFGKTSPYGKPSAEEIQIAEKWYADNPPHPKLTELEKKYDNLRKSGGGFMGKKWDYDVPKVEVWKECLRVLKPGGHLLSFSGTRTYHRMAVAIEDAGFEIRDMIEWVYGSGFPKSLNIGKAVDKLQGNEREITGINEDFKKKKAAEVRRGTDNGRNYNEKHNPGSGGFSDPSQVGIITKGTSEWEGWQTALKPAHEPICMARKPLSEKTVAENCLKWGTGGINIDESRVETDWKNDPTKRGWQGRANYKSPFESGELKGEKVKPNEQGRFPANLIHDNSEEVRECFPESKGDSINRKPRKQGNGTSIFGVTQNGYETQGKTDSGNASRFFKSIPNHEPICMARKPLSEKTVALNCLKWGTGGLNIDESRVEAKDGVPLFNCSSTVRWGNNGTPEGLSNPRSGEMSTQGRFPANLIHDNSEEVRECFPETGGGKYNKQTRKRKGFMLSGSEENIQEANAPDNYGDSGNASRFFKSIIYQAKASKKERNKGCEGLETTEKFTAGNYGQSSTCKDCNKTINGSNNHSNCSGEYFYNESISKNTKNNHPTVKPIALMEYLIKMVSREDALILDPFAGSGTTGVACLNTNRQFIVMEKEEKYYEIIKARVAGFNKKFEPLTLFGNEM